MSSLLLDPSVGSTKTREAVCDVQSDRPVAQIKGGAGIGDAVMEEAISEGSVGDGGGTGRAVLAHMEGQCRGRQEGGKEGNDVACHDSIV
jgi:hypothetical protein